MALNGNLIEIEDLTKVFYTDEVETHALSGIHLTISRGEYVAMSGPSGCGKSTLLSILGLLDTPTGGKYLPVSYTHLDVYKRQKYMRGNVANNRNDHPVSGEVIGFVVILGQDVRVGKAH